MKKEVKQVLDSARKLPMSPEEKKQVRNIFLTGAVETGLMKIEDAKRLR
jgi:hypothetical protein